jgi:hypothetical protein
MAQIKKHFLKKARKIFAPSERALENSLDQNKQNQKFVAAARGGVLFFKKEPLALNRDAHA